MKRFFVPLLACSLLLLGAGCKQSTPTAPSSPTASETESDVFLPPPPSEETENQRNLRELREAVEAFRTLKTFRAKLTIEGTSGATTGQIDVVKPDRFHGTLRVPKETQTSEVIGVSDTLYVRLPDGSWSSIQTPAVSKALAEAFRSTVDGNGSVIEAALPDEAIVTKRDDAAKGCTRYQTQITSADTTAADVQICVSKGLPKLMNVQSPQGTIEVEYFDYNTLFVIERPTVAR